MSVTRIVPLLFALLLVSFRLAAAEEKYSFEKSQQFLTKYCSNCHKGKSAVGGFDTERIGAIESLGSQPQKWAAATKRIRNGEMPPKGAPAPSLDERDLLSNWVDEAVRAAVCAAGIAPGPAPVRRLNRDEYAATIRDLLDIHLDLAQALPADGAGGEGFDNAAETLFLSPLLSEKYMEVAKFVMDFAAKEFKSREKLFVTKPGRRLSQAQAARKNITTFLARAFRRPVNEVDIAPYMTLYRTARAKGQPFEASVIFALRAALISPMFLYRVEVVNNSGKARPLEPYALASKLSYFLWGSMPDDLLFDVAASGKLHDPSVLRELTGIMLRNDRSLVFVQRFVEQWLRTRELSSEKAPDAKLFPSYSTDEELRSDIRLQPVLFFREILVRDLSLLNLLESKHTIGTSNLAKHYGIELPLKQGSRKQPQWVELPDGSRRGGLLGMAAVLAVSSYPYRTSPVLRGTWILDSILGSPPPPPPADVPALEESNAGAAPVTVREQLTRHRANPACANCHSRIDPLGFALENFDVIGRWREEEGGKPIDNSGELPDGTKIQGPEQLRAVLLSRKDDFVRNLTEKMLGYALGRGLTIQDACTVDSIVAELRENNYSARKFIEAIVLSVPFRYQAARPAAPVSRGIKHSSRTKERNKT